VKLRWLVFKFDKMKTSKYFIIDNQFEKMNSVISLILAIILLSILPISCTSKSKQNLQIKTTNFTAVKQMKLVKKNISNKNSIKIATWNIQNLGGTKNDQEILQIAKIIKDFDVVAIQEVVGKDPKGAQAVAKIWNELNRMGSKWDYRISNRTKSPSANMSERYAFIWKTSRLRLVNKPYLDSALEDLCVREPYIAKFTAKKMDDSFFLINYHSRVHSQNPEEEIKYFKEYPERLKSENIIIAGDFNLNERHSVWNNLYAMGFKASLQNSPTTLKRKCKFGKYLSHSIDNIYFNARQFTSINSGKIDFVTNCENLTNARFLSDHLAVFNEFSFN
jgi:endonuclease/exonuclease/phosphatase family metal-dependent hydrolase